MSPDTPYADATSSPRPSGLVGPVTILSAGKTTRQAFHYDLRGRLVKTGGFSHSSLEYPLDPTLEGNTFTYDDRANILSGDSYSGMLNLHLGRAVYHGDRLTAHVSDVMHIIGGVACHDTLATFSYDDRARMTRDSWDDTRFGYNYLGLTGRVPGRHNSGFTAFCACFTNY